MQISSYAGVLAELQAGDGLARPRWPFERIEIAPPSFKSACLDLVLDVAAPWALDLACKLTGAASDLEPIARAVFDAAADGGADHNATAQLGQALAGEHMAMRVQAFVAVSQTLPCFLGRAWLALIENPQERAAICTPQAIEELLRFAGPAQAVTRGCKTLMLATANRDPARFAEPDRLDLSRDAAGHLALGAGAHACIGASFIRDAATCATTALVNHYTLIELAGPVRWRGGVRIRGVASLPVRLT